MNLKVLGAKAPDTLPAPEDVPPPTWMLRVERGCRVAKRAPEKTQEANPSTEK